MTEPQEAPQPPRIETRFVRSNFQRVIHADGAWGTFTPQWNIHMALYSERWALPEGTSVIFEPSGIIEEPNRGSGLIREIEADVILSEEAAVRLRTWLDERITQLRQARYGSDSSPESGE